MAFSGFLCMAEYNIANIPGDYCGKTNNVEGNLVLDKAAKIYGFKINRTEYPNGSEHCAKTGHVLSDSEIEEFRGHDAVYLTAVGGHPDVDKSLIETDLLLRTRFELDLYINERPSKLYPGVDAEIRKIHPNLPDGYEITVVREGVGGLYKGLGGITTLPDGTIVAQQIMDYNSQEVDRTVRYAFELSRRKGQELGVSPLPVTLGFKSNVLEYVSKGLWEPRFFDIAKEEFPDVPADYQHIDALNGPVIINNELPKNGWIIVTGNMFGDKISDLLNALFGGMGNGAAGCRCPEGNPRLNPRRVGMFEPVHGSSPKDYGKNVVSPIATILSGAMMLEDLGEVEAAQGIERAVWNALSSRKIPDLTTHSGVPTQQQTEYVLEELAE